MYLPKEAGTVQPCEEKTQSISPMGINTSWGRKEAVLFQWCPEEVPDRTRGKGENRNTGISASPKSIL